MAVSSHPIEYRELRRSDLPVWEKVVLQAIGLLERSTGLDKTTVAQFRTLGRPGLWAFLRLLRALGVAPVRVFVATDAGQVQSTAAVLFLPRSGYIAGVATDAPARGKGLATHVIESAHAAVRRRRKPWIALDVEADNETAIRVYRRLGYRETAEFAWFIGPTPGSSPVPGATEVRGSSLKSVVEWVDRQRPAPLRDALPARPRTLVHLETIARPAGAKGRTWALGPPTGIRAVARAYYTPMTQTGMVFVAGWEAGLSSDTLRGLVSPAVEWFREIGATRSVLVVPDPTGPWDDVASSLGLPRTVSTTLMIRATAG
jgi:ribosomal protein S18 acetylase RimI-like enzyme